MKQIKDYPNYLITLTGKVFSLKTMKWLKTSYKKDNREYIKLCKNGVVKDYSIHRLIALTYLPNIENKPQINHIDGNPKNNIIYNLEWVTQSQNIKHAWDNKLRVVTKKQSDKIILLNKQNTKKVINLSNGIIYNSLTEAANENNIDKSTLSKWLLGVVKNKTSLKYI